MERTYFLGKEVEIQEDDIDKEEIQVRNIIKKLSETHNISFEYIFVFEDGDLKNKITV